MLRLPKFHPQSAIAPSQMPQPKNDFKLQKQLQTTTLHFSTTSQPMNLQGVKTSIHQHSVVATNA